MVHSSNFGFVPCHCSLLKLYFSKRKKIKPGSVRHFSGPATYATDLSERYILCPLTESSVNLSETILIFFQLGLFFLLEPLFLLISLDYSDARNQLLLMDNDDMKVTGKYLKIIIVVCNVINIL